jgi:hypothetical protein
MRKSYFFCFKKYFYLIFFFFKTLIKKKIDYDIYFSGKNNHGESGLENKESINKVTENTYFKKLNLKIKKITCGGTAGNL